MRFTVEREFVVRKLSELFEGLSNVKVAILFGSIARGSKYVRDIDVAVEFAGKTSLLDLGDLVSSIATHLGIPEDLVDVVDLDSVPPIMLLEILGEGVVLKADKEALDRLYEKASRGVDQLVEVSKWSTLDPEPRVNKVIINSRIEEVRRNTKFIKEEILVRRVDELNYKDVLALERAVHRLIEAMLDICRHLVSVYSLGLIESYGRYSLRLAEAGKMPRDLAQDVSRLAGLRNILVHRYIELDLRKLVEAAKTIVKDIAPKFLDWAKDIDP